MREVGTPARVSWSAMASEESPCCACLSWARGGCSSGAGPGRPRQLPACQGRSRRGGALQWRPQTHSPPAGCAPPTAHSPPARWVPMSLKLAIYDFLLDPMCGSGGTALAALMEGRAAVAIDRSPAATFITKNHCTPVYVDALHKAFAELKAKVKPEIDWLYATRCDRCGG